MIQIAASFPAPMIFPLVTLAILAVGANFSRGCVLLMLLGAQWYILFNVLAGATALPQDLRETVDVYGLGGWLRWRTLYLPAVFPHLITGLHDDGDAAEEERDVLALVDAVEGLGVPGRPEPQQLPVKRLGVRQEDRRRIGRADGEELRAGTRRTTSAATRSSADSPRRSEP